MENGYARFVKVWQVMGLLTIGSLALGAAPRALGQGSTKLSAKDTAAIQATIERYRTLWLSGDAEGVLNTLADDAVLMPAQAGDPVVGREAMRKFWWPAGGPPVKITKFEITMEQIGGDGEIAHVRGHVELEWSMEENGVTKNHVNFETYLNVMQKLPDGSWRISHHMWDSDPKKGK